MWTPLLVLAGTSGDGRDTAVAARELLLVMVLLLLLCSWVGDAIYYAITPMALYHFLVS